MSELNLMVTITERSKLTTFLSFYRERQVPVQFISLALGTASNETLNYLGLERSDKCVFASFVTDEKWEELRRVLRREPEKQQLRQQHHADHRQQAPCRNSIHVSHPFSKTPPAVRAGVRVPFERRAAVGAAACARGHGRRGCPVCPASVRGA